MNIALLPVYKLNRSEIDRLNKLNLTSIRKLKGIDVEILTVEEFVTAVNDQDINLEGYWLVKINSK